MLDGKKDDKIEGSSLGGSPGSEFIIEIGSYKVMLVRKEGGELGVSELG